MTVTPRQRATWIWGAALVALATALRAAWVLSVPTVPVSDFAMYRESANYLSEFGALDPGFIYMPGFVVLLAWVKDLGGDLLAQKLLGVGFGGLGAAGLFLLTNRLLDGGPRHQGVTRDSSAGGGPPAEGAGDEVEARVQARFAWRRWFPCPHAVVATLLYAFWPAGVAMASVVGTDVPAAALVVSALALLAALGPCRPFTAALAFGAAMGLAAWVRAVALPLSGLAFFYWIVRPDRRLARRAGRALLYTAVGVATTLLVLLPWAVRHLRQSGELYFTDDHGGITALIGANPNSEGTYTRALNRLFQDVTGRSVLDEPHRQTDRIAYGLAREWLRFEPGYAVGLAVLKADRLFDPEERLLYWPIVRPGVLVGPRAAFFAAHREAIAGLTDGFGLTMAGLAIIGVVAAVARRRNALLALLPFQLALVATYTTFFAEPRYRLPVEILAFPFAAAGVAELARLGQAVAWRSRAALVGAGRSLVPACTLIVLWRLGWPALLNAGASLRARHRWAVTEAEVDGRARLLLWKAAAPLPASSPLAGAPNGVHLRAGAPGRPTSVVVRLGQGPLPAGRYVVHMRAEAESAGPFRLTVSGDGDASSPPSPSETAEIGAGGAAEIAARVAHPGGAFVLRARLARAATNAGAATEPGLAGSVWVTGARIERLD